MAPRRGYWSFYWPLALSSVVMLLERQFQNGVLARYPDGTAQLATFALAASGFHLFDAAVIFVPQLIAVMGRTRASRRTCRHFVFAVGLLLSLPLLFMAFTGAGQRLLAGLLNIPEALAPDVARYLQWLAPLVLVNALRNYGVGVLVLGARTGRVTVLHAVHMVALIGVLLAGRALGWGALPTIALATVASNGLHLILVAAAAAGTPVPPPSPGPPPLRVRWRDLCAFFWPVALTSTMFAMSRPVLYAFVNLTPDAVIHVAALRVAFDFAMFFQSPVNQFRHVYATYGAEDPHGVRRFMMRVTAVLVVAMAAVALSPAGRFLFGDLMGIEEAVLRRALESMVLLCAAPLVIALRNLNHGKLMVRRRTTAMGLASVLRVAAIGVASHGLYRIGWLDHRSASAALVLGFAVEALVVHLACMRHARRHS